MKYDLAIAYRIYPGISKVPPAFPNDKYRLAELCLSSLAGSLAGLKVKIYALLDACPESYAELFKRYFSEADLEIIRLDKAGNKVTFKKQIEILSSQDDAEIVYFAEDDYFYIKPLKNLVELIGSGKADFATPYEHPVVYSDNYVIRREEIDCNSQKYVKVQHACLTFMTTKTSLLKSRKYLSIFSDWFGSDFVVWGCLTLGRAYFRYAKLLLSPKNYTLENIKVFGSMLFFAGQRFLLNRRYNLYMPQGTLATHMESDFLSPGIDWREYFKDKQ